MAIAVITGEISCEYLRVELEHRRLGRRRWKKNGVVSGTICVRIKDRRDRCRAARLNLKSVRVRRMLACRRLI